MTATLIVLHHLPFPFPIQRFYSCCSSKSSSNVAEDDQFQGMSSSLQALEWCALLQITYVDLHLQGLSRHACHILELIQKRDQNVTPKGGSTCINFPQIEGLSLEGNKGFEKDCRGRSQDSCSQSLTGYKESFFGPQHLGKI